MNDVDIVGKVWNDPVVNDYSQHKVCRFSLDHIEKIAEDKVRHNFFECEAWNDKAVDLSYLEKGDSVYIKGQLKFSSWEDKNTGDKRQKVNITVRQFLKLPKEVDGEIPF